MKPVFPKWVPFGCGSLAVLLIAILVVAGQWASHGGIGTLFDFAMTQMKPDLQAAYIPSVTPQQRKAFESEFDRLRARVRNNNVDLAHFQRVLQAMGEATRDNKLTPLEVETLTKQMAAVDKGK